MQEIIVYIILIATALYALRMLHRRFRRPRQEDACRDCTAPCALRQELTGRHKWPASQPPAKRPCPASQTPPTGAREKFSAENEKKK